ncbi:MAG: trans-2-enoyl-CoA reductase family protein [Candidatus Poribacteria bacterium]|nr:trans-2-enoyl-CoA reductase family protein [Candidatus Poribacteria bacterium]MDE0505006.1 trans-2-enoyl-CoA reductase family protein [Candidatus Poribacteria bacterium]
MSVQVIKPRIRGFICTNAHPVGCEKNVQEQVDYIKSLGAQNSDNLNVLVVGGSTGYGLASRIALTWLYGGKSIGVYYERPADGKRTATAGFYNSYALRQLAAKDGFFASDVNGDAFSDDLKRETIDRIKRELGRVDVLVYSLASPRRFHPRTGAEHQSVLKPIGEPYSGKTIDLNREVIADVHIEPATDAEVEDTVAVMGGEDLEMWVEALMEENLLAKECTVVTYTYIGHELTWPIYRDGTIGKAKEDLEGRINALDVRLSSSMGGHAYLSVNKAVITQASSAIPVVPLYVSMLNDIMDAQGTNEDPIRQMGRLFSEHLGPSLTPALDADRRLRLDDRELRSEIVGEVTRRWDEVNTENFLDLSDYAGFKRGFRNLFGFEVAGVDYDAPVDIELV